MSNSSNKQLPTGKQVAGRHARDAEVPSSSSFIPPPTFGNRQPSPSYQNPPPSFQGPFAALRTKHHLPYDYDFGSTTIEEARHFLRSDPDYLNLGTLSMSDVVRIKNEYSDVNLPWPVFRQIGEYQNMYMNGELFNLHQLPAKDQYFQLHILSTSLSVKIQTNLNKPSTGQRALIPLDPRRKYNGFQPFSGMLAEDNMYDDLRDPFPGDLKQREELPDTLGGYEADMSGKSRVRVRCAVCGFLSSCAWRCRDNRDVITNGVRKNYCQLEPCGKYRTGR